MSLTRRHMIASGAAAGSAAVLSACGAEGREERTTERDIGLLQRSLEAEATLADLYEIAGDQTLAGPVAAAVTRFGTQARQHVTELSEQISDAGGDPDPTPRRPPAAESAVEAIRIALDAAIATGHEIVGYLSTIEARRAVYRVMISNSGQLAVVRGVLGEQQVPEPFVTGRPEPPLVVDPETGASAEGNS